jgi:hypothetical protein
MTDLANGLRLVSTVACLTIIAAFVLWGADQGRAESDRQVAVVAEGTPSGQSGVGTAAPATEHDGLRGLVERVDDKLTSPFQGVAESSSQDWVRRGVPALLALLLYGVVARIAIGYVPQRN